MGTTPSASQYGTQVALGADGTRSGKVRPSLETIARHGLWPTPTKQDAAGSRRATARQAHWKSNPGVTLTDAVWMWPTPTATLGSNGGRVTPEKGREGGTLTEAVSARLWPTPTARDWRSGHASEVTHARNARPLSEVVTRSTWATPTAADAIRGCFRDPEMRTKGGKRGGQLVDQAGGSLNPLWVEWLMGWPLGWGDCDSPVTDGSRWWARMRSAFSTLLTVALTPTGRSTSATPDQLDLFVA